MKQNSTHFLCIFVFLCLLHPPFKRLHALLDDLSCLGGKMSICNRGPFGCNSETKSCQSFVTFRSRTPYDSPTSIAQLVGSEASSIAFLNNISPNNQITPEKFVIVPIPCSCSDSFFLHYTLYTVETSRETYATVDYIYQGLTTSQILLDQNIRTDKNISVGTVLKVPLICGCPSENQRRKGAISLLSYEPTSSESVASIAHNFGVDKESILEANRAQNGTNGCSTFFVPMKNDSCIIHPENSFCYKCPNDFPRDARRQDTTCKPSKKFQVKLVTLLGIGIGWGLLCICALGYMLYRFLTKRRYEMRKGKFFKQNGGFLLQQRLSACGTSERARIFTAEELQSATDNYNQSRVLGQGGFGTVYKGMLPDGSVVAVKRSKAIDKSQIKQFINEIVILSEVNHRNIVKLLGCCLETEVPILVYEFIPNGTLHHHIHDYQQEQESSLSWDHRLRIACEVAGALAYMHSSASIPIFHRDIKSSNILLDDKYSAKVTDFGTSRFVPTDKTHLTTAVQGTLGYLDPEYFRLSQFTDRSDVYSFGVVLLELLTGETPFSFARSVEGRNLVAVFIALEEENQLLEILDARVAEEAGEEDIQAFAKIVIRCLKLKGKKRPTMKQVAIELEGLIRSQIGLEIHQEPEQPLTDERSYMCWGCNANSE